MQHGASAMWAARSWVGLLGIGLLGNGLGCGSESQATEGAAATTIQGPQSSTAGSASVVDQATGADGEVEGPPTGLPTAGAEGTSAPADLDGTSTRDGLGAVDFCDVLTIAQAKCQSCHGQETVAGAPMSLVDYEDFVAPSVVDPTRSVAEASGARIHSAQQPMPPTTATALTADELATLDAWIAEGAQAPAGQCETTGAATDGGDGEQPFPECDDVFEIRASGDTARPQTVAGNTESHPRVTMDAPWGDREAWVVGWHPLSDNKKVLHHWILYQAGGFDGKFLIGWAYGQGGENTPDGVGIFMPSGARSLMLDMHYYNLGNAMTEEDSSGLEVCVTYTEPKNVATTLGLGALPSVAPGQRVDNSSQCTVSITPGQTVRLMSVAPHMHKLGINGKLELIRNGETTVIHDAPFTFGDQTLYKVDVELMDGDILKTTCTYENMTDHRVSFGQDSDDEMCFNFVEYYPMGALQCRGGFNI